MHREWSDPTELIAALNAGDKRALEHVYNTYQRIVWWAAYKITGNTAEAEDIVMETFFKFWEKRAIFHVDSNLKGWLVIVAMNKAKDRFRKQHRQEISEQEAEYHTDKLEQDNHYQNLLIKSELLDRALATMNEMPAAMKEIFRMFFVEGWSSAQIAEKLGISMDTVRVQKHRAILILKKTFRLEDPPD
ncbi:MAG: RNA polymerase sigma factor [Chitinophagaceae bacterium]|nr:RNA polymerase sigma factor [Chitinophagaceae bacterium]